MSTYKRTSSRKLVFTEAVMEDIQRKLEEGDSKRSIAKDLNIPESTLRKRLKSGTVPTSLGRFNPVFSADKEKELTDYVKEMDRRFYGITMQDLMYFAFEFANANKIKHCFNENLKRASKTWARGFCQRNNITLRTPELCSLGRMIGFNKPQVELFFKNLKIMYEKYNFSPNRIFNMDETGISTVPNKTPKILTVRGKKHVGKVSSGERGELATAVCCMNATGNYIPPALIFKRKRMNEDLFQGAPTGTLCLISDTGFINTDLFFKWIRHFNDYVKPTLDDPILLIFDNHSSHRSLDVINYCKENYIHLLSLPPHASHKIQPLDKAYFGPFKTSYSKAVENWLVSNPGKPVTTKQLASLFKTAYNDVSNIEKAEKAFEATGIWPYNPQKIDDNDFAPSLVTDRPLNKSQNERDNVEDGTVLVEIDFNQLTGMPINNSTSIINDILDLSSAEVIFEGIDDSSENHVVRDEIIEPKGVIMPTTPEKIISSSSWQEVAGPSYCVKPEELRPFPKFTGEQQRRRHSQKSEILTSTPFMETLKEQSRSNNKSVKRKIVEDDGSNKQEISKTKEKTLSGKNEKKLKNKKKRTLRNDDCGKENEDINCPGCGEKFLDPPSEDWIQCGICQKWWHENCSNYVSGKFDCDLCL